MAKSKTFLLISTHLTNVDLLNINTVFTLKTEIFRVKIVVRLQSLNRWQYTTPFLESTQFLKNTIGLFFQPTCLASRKTSAAKKHDNKRIPLSFNLIFFFLLIDDTYNLLACQSQLTAHALRLPIQKLYKEQNIIYTCSIGCVVYASKYFFTQMPI